MTALSQKGLEISALTLGTLKGSHPPSPELKSMNLPAKRGIIGKLVNLMHRSKRLREFLGSNKVDLIVSFQPPANLTALLSGAPQVIATFHVPIDAALRRFPLYVLSFALYRRAKKVVVPSHGAKEKVKGFHTRG